MRYQVTDPILSDRYLPPVSGTVNTRRRHTSGSFVHIISYRGWTTSHQSTKYASTKHAYSTAEANDKGTIRYKQQLKVSTTLDVLYGDGTIGTYVDDR